MHEWSVTLDSPDLVFNASHFLVIEGEAEPLHGHDFRVRVRVTCDVDKDGLVIDFIRLRSIVREVIAAFEHKVLLPSSPAVIVHELDGQLRIECANRAWQLPAQDCMVLEVDNCTTERLAELIASKIRRDIAPLLAGRTGNLAVELEETPGAKATRVVSLP